MSNRDGGWDEEPEYDIDPDIEDYERYEDEDGAPGGKRRSLMLLSVIALLAVFAGVVFLAYRQGTQQGPNGAPPILRADGEPTKELPENPGGKKFPHQDAGVYNRITGDGESEPSEGEQLLPPAEEPLAIDNSAIPEPQDQQALDRMAQSLETGGIQSRPLDDASSGASSTAPVQQAAPAEEVPAAKASEPVEQTTSSPVSSTSSSGGYVVQLAAFRDEPSAREAFKKLQAKYPNLLGARAIDIQRADLAEKGIYYRLRAGYMDKATADGLCADLDAQGQGCLVRPK
ncbi:SPOR domain-containing protein [Parvibaculum sp.]|uniref:SPOR domain-containing protein n=1 Tax=Parvibaculum sp. TaxID=2024848 RepID=UPI0032977DA3